MSLITAAQVREHFPALVGTGEDSLLLTLVDRADALMASFCGWPVPGTPSAPTTLTMVSSAYTRVYDGPAWDDDHRIDLGHPWVASITSAAVDSSGDWSYATAITPSDLVLDTRAGALFLKPSSSSAWYNTSRSNQVVFTAGFAATPPDLVATCAMMVRHLLSLRRVNLGETAASQGGQSVTRADADALVPAGVRNALAPYVLWSSRVG